MRNSRSSNVLVVNEFPDMRLFMSAALRYALPRQTYAPSHFLDYLECNLDKFSDDSLELFQKDIEDFYDQFPGDQPAVIMATRKQARYVYGLMEKRRKKDE